jgi:hypothetical protein
VPVLREPLKPDSSIVGPVHVSPRHGREGLDDLRSIKQVFESYIDGEVPYERELVGGDQMKVVLLSAC